MNKELKMMMMMMMMTTTTTKMMAMVKMLQKQKNIFPVVGNKKFRAVLRFWSMAM